MIAKCLENGNNAPKVKLNLANGMSKDEEPYLLIELPVELFDGEHEDYDGAYMFTITLRELLDEYTDNFWASDHGKGTPKVINLLREFADGIGNWLKELLDRKAKGTLYNRKEED